MILIAAAAILVGIPAFLLSLWVWIKEREFDPTLFWFGLLLVFIGFISV